MSTWGLTLIFDPVTSTYFRPPLLSKQKIWTHMSHSYTRDSTNAFIRDNWNRRWNIPYNDNFLRNFISNLPHETIHSPLLDGNPLIANMISDLLIGNSRRLAENLWKLIRTPSPMCICMMYVYFIVDMNCPLEIGGNKIIFFAFVRVEPFFFSDFWNEWTLTCSSKASALQVISILRNCFASFLFFIHSLRCLGITPMVYACMEKPAISHTTEVLHSFTLFAIFTWRDFVDMERNAS